MIEDKNTKVQLFILTHEDEDLHDTLFLQDLEDFVQVDILYYGDQATLIKRYAYRIHPDWMGNKYRLHLCSGTVESHINSFVEPQTYCYLVSHSDTPVSMFVTKLNKLKKENGDLMLIKGDEYYNGTAINTLMHKFLCGFGEQTMVEKLSIFCKNFNVPQMVFDSLESFYE